jgi:hypothetical protein
MSTVRYGDVVQSTQVVEGESLEDKVKRRRASNGEEPREVPSPSEKQSDNKPTESK